MLFKFQVNFSLQKWKVDKKFEVEKCRKKIISSKTENRKNWLLSKSKSRKIYFQ